MRYHFRSWWLIFCKFGLEIHVSGVQKTSKSEILFIAAPNRTYANPVTYDGCNLEMLNWRMEGIYQLLIVLFILDQC